MAHRKEKIDKFDTKEKTEVEAGNIVQAKMKVQVMFPTHRISSYWLITK